jgi:hypothetical protein
MSGTLSDSSQYPNTYPAPSQSVLLYTETHHMKKRRQGTGLARSSHQTHFTPMAPPDVEEKPRRIQGAHSSEATNHASGVARSGPAVLTHVGSGAGQEAERPQRGPAHV